MLGIFATTSRAAIGLQRRWILHNHDTRSLADDLLRGGEAIKEFIFGAGGKRSEVYYYTSGNRAAEENRIPTFKIGKVVCARKSSILKWVEDQERASLTRRRKPVAKPAVVLPAEPVENPARGRKRKTRPETETHLSAT